MMFWLQPLPLLAQLMLFCIKVQILFLLTVMKLRNLSPVLLETYLKTCKKRPKALIVTHLYGQCADIEATRFVPGIWGFLIEDAARIKQLFIKIGKQEPLEIYA